MRLQATITIRRVDNGFTVSSRSDVPNEGANKIAATEADAKRIAAEMLEIALPNTPPPKG